MLRQLVKVTEVRNRSITVQDDFLDKLTILLEFITGEPIVGSEATLVRGFESYRVFVTT